MSADLWNENICRCCHYPSNFKSLFTTYYIEGQEETYSSMLGETFDIKVNPFMDIENVSQNICNHCVTRLKDAFLFKHQVMLCEQKLKESLENFQNASLKTIEKHKEDTKHVDTESYLPLEYYDNIDNESIQNPSPNNSFNHSEPHTSIDKPNEKKKHYCQICQKGFTHQGSLECHQKTHLDNNNKYTCLFCDHVSNTTKKLTKHVLDKHANEQNYPCSCSQIFNSAEDWKNHIVVHEKKLHCDFCNRQFASKKGLREHLKIHAGNRKFTCEACNKSFTHKQTLESHKLTHTGEKPFVCEICGSRFSQRTHLVRHKRIIHNGIKQHTCKICQKQFSSKSYLKIHKRQHSGEKPFECQHCSKNFAAYTTLKVHLRMHTGTKPYACNFCDRRFTQMSSFKLHERTHTGERPYSCIICNKNFSDNGYLKIHMKIHSDEKNYKCQVCQKSFRESRQLKRHDRIHTGLKAYSCEVCNKSVCNLSKHMRVHDIKIFCN